jgi:hypothetical protein
MRKKTEQPMIFYNRSRCSLEEVRGTPRKRGNGSGFEKSEHLKTRFHTAALFPKQALHAGRLPAAMLVAKNHSDDRSLFPSEPLCPSQASAVVENIHLDHLRRWRPLVLKIEL